MNTPMRNHGTPVRGADPRKKAWRTRLICRGFAATLAAVLALAPTAFAQTVPKSVPFQARLVDASGVPVPPGTAVVFTIHDAPSGGSALWGPELHTVTPVNGVVSVQLGAGDAPIPVDANVFAGRSRWLEVKIGGETLSPRFEIGSSAYALRADKVSPGAIGSAEVLDESLTAADLAPNSVGASEIGPDAVTANELAPQAVGTSELANNAVGSTQVADGSLTAADLAMEPGLASIASTDMVVLIGANKNVVARSITAPAAGFVVAIANAQVDMFWGAGEQAGGSFSLSTVSATHNADNERVVLSSFASGVCAYSVAAQEIFSVNPGTTTVYFVANDENTGGALSWATNAQMTLMYFPTAYGDVARHTGSGGPSPILSRIDGR